MEYEIAATTDNNNNEVQVQESNDNGYPKELGVLLVAAGAVAGVALWEGGKKAVNWIKGKFKKDAPAQPEESEQQKGGEDENENIIDEPETK